LSRAIKRKKEPFNIATERKASEINRCCTCVDLQNPDYLSLALSLLPSPAETFHRKPLLTQAEEKYTQSILLTPKAHKYPIDVRTLKRILCNSNLIGVTTFKGQRMCVFRE
jgi:hypothetical protein